jgi:hypothetical protein
MTDGALQQALEVEAVISSCRVEHDTGSSWARVPGATTSRRSPLST